METTSGALEKQEETNFIARFALAATRWTQRWMPDAFIFALLATVIVIIAAFILDPEVRANPFKLATAWGHGFWSLLTFSMQASLTIVTGSALATTPPARKLIDVIAGKVHSRAGAVATVAFFSMVAGYLNWAFSLIFSAILAKEFARRIPKVDYRALAACSFMCMGSVWAQGLSSSAALFMATPGSMPEALVKLVGGLIPLTDTIFLWQSLASVAVEVVLVTIIAYKFTPPAHAAVTAEDLGIDLHEDVTRNNKHSRPGEYLEYSPLLTIIFTIISVAYIYETFAKKGMPALDLNMVNFIFLIGALLLHWRPIHFMHSMRDATPAIWGVVLQFPFYAGIFGLIVGTNVSSAMAHFFIDISNQYVYPVVVGIYSVILGIAVPSGGSKWIIEAPYLVAAAQHYHMHLGWLVSIYNLGEAMANLLQPFWMLPVLGMMHLKARDVMGFTFIFATFLIPVVLLMAFLFNLTLSPV
ncbi:MAG: short-chain fatty acid transporter [Candidimonas sp.]|nr:MAG: short-chain fatty acid transporter [Candidimonas sp.]